MDASEQIQRISEFLDGKRAEVAEKIRKKEFFLDVGFPELAEFDPDLAEILLDHPEDILQAAEVFGSFILITNPGNCSGLYSVLDKVAAILSNGISCSREVETTMFTTLISFFHVPFFFFPSFAIFTSNKLFIKGNI